MNVKAPWSVQLELVEGCNRICPFCGINSIRKGPGGYEYMSAGTAARVAMGIADLCPLARIEVAMHGEPLQHPDCLERLAIFRAALPDTQIQLTTNGRAMAGRMQHAAERLFAVGVNFIMLDTYEPERQALQAEARELSGIRVLDFYKECMPTGWSPYHNHRKTVQRTILVMDDLGLRTGEARSRVIVNQAGNNPAQPTPEKPLERMCTLPFREITIAWNGNVNLCCEDWGHEYTCGNVNERPLGHIWAGSGFEAARRVLFARYRGMTPCSRCDKGSGPRVGLVPKYGPPTEDDLEEIRAVHAKSRPQNGRAAWIDPNLLQHLARLAERRQKK